jgi:hypothetical protein
VRHGGILCTFFGNWYEMQVTTVQNGLGSRGPVNPNTGEEACGPETLSDEELAARRAELRFRARRRRRRLVAAALAVLLLNEAVLARGLALVKNADVQAT